MYFVSVKVGLEAETTLLFSCGNHFLRECGHLELASRGYCCLWISMLGPGHLRRLYQQSALQRKYHDRFHSRFSCGAYQFLVEQRYENCMGCTHLIATCMWIPVSHLHMLCAGEKISFATPAQCVLANRNLKRRRLYAYFMVNSDFCHLPL